MRMFRIGDKVEYWYQMGKVGTVVGIRRSDREVWLVGGTPASSVDVVVRFEDGSEKLYPVGELRLVE